MLQLPCLDVNRIEKCTCYYEKFLYLLDQMKRGMKTIEELKREVYEHGLNDDIREAFLYVLEDADIASMSKEERIIYEAKLKRYHDDRARLDYAIEDGIRQGLELAEKQKAKNIAERNLEIAKLMKEQSIDVTVIAKCTGLSVEEINNI